MGKITTVTIRTNISKFWAGLATAELALTGISVAAFIEALRDKIPGSTPESIILAGAVTGFATAMTLFSALKAIEREKTTIEGE